MEQLQKIRRNIHTYPFKYRYIPDNEFFSLCPGSIYIHIPFCTTKCHFCDYTIYTDKREEVHTRYVEALCKEINSFSGNRVFPSYRIEAIYFGGGTPGVLNGNQLLKIYTACRDNFELSEDCEVCAEFDPNCVNLEKIQQIQEGGFNRISMGVQSFDSEILKQSNRPHDVSSIYRAYEAIRASGCSFVNLDLIYPLPKLTEEIWEDSVKQAVALKPDCITIYGLEVWPGTPYFNWLKKGKLDLPENQIEVKMYSHAADAVEKAGFVPRSNSGYYHPDRTSKYCRFLDFYWRTWPMIGFGVSSKSVVGNRLWTNIKLLQEYIRRADAKESVMDFATFISKPQEMRRVMIRGLKMCEVDKSDFHERFGVSMESIFHREIKGLVDDQLLLDEASRVTLTRKGRIYGTNVYERFYTEEDIRPPTAEEVPFGISSLITK